MQNNKKQLVDATVQASPGPKRTRSVSCLPWLQLISNAGIPLMIATITVLITIYQQNLAQANRERDLIEAREQRKQDGDEARRRREEDMEMARQQREAERNNSEIQRAIELQIAEDKRRLEEKIAEEQRNLAQEQRKHELDLAAKNREHELALEDERLKEQILIEYQRDLANILLKHEGNIVDVNDRSRFAIQMRTRTALRLLDPPRRTIVIRSLHDANLLNRKIETASAAILSFANASFVDFGAAIDAPRYDFLFNYEHFAAQNADLRHSSFRQVDLSQCDSGLSYSMMDGTIWTHSRWRNIALEEFSMKGAQFLDVWIALADVMSANLDQSSFNDVLIDDVVTIRQSSMRQVRFQSSTFQQLLLEEVMLNDAHFDSVQWSDSAIHHSEMNGIHLINVSFFAIIMKNLTMQNCVLENVEAKECRLHNVDMRGCRGFEMDQWIRAIFYNWTLPNGTFVKYFLS